MGKYDTCPVCGHLSVEYAGENVDRDDAILVPAECCVCGATWIQRYIYAGDEEIETGDE